MRKVVEFFLDNYKFTIVLTFFVLAFGLGGMQKMNSESFPSVNIATAFIETRYDGASAEDIETKITKPLEDEVRTVNGIKDVKSVSQAGYSRITVRIDLDKYDVEEAMADLQRAVDSVSDLPADLKDPPSFTEVKSEEIPVIEVAVMGSNEARARDKVADHLKEELEDNKNVLSVRRDGFTERAFQIYLDTKKLDQKHIGINEVIQRVQQRNINVPGGHLKADSSQELLRIEAKVKNKTELENIVIRANFSGEKVFLKDVARVEDSHEEAKQLASYNGEEATLLVVTKKGGADTLALVEDVDERIRVFQNKYEGEFKFVTYFNEAQKVKTRLEILVSNALTGLALVIFFLLIFLPGRIGMMASLSLPLGILATLGIMPLYDMSLNTVTISALVIVLGMLVDNAVVISEYYARLVREEGIEPREAVLQSVSQLWLPITATAFTTIAAFLPMLVTTGVMGQFIKYIPITVTIALLLSLAESFFFLPMRIQSKRDQKTDTSKDSSDWFQKRVIPKFEAFMELVVKHRYIALTVFSLLLVTSVLLIVVFNKLILFPPDQTEIYVGRLEMQKGTTLELTRDTLEKIAVEINQTGDNHFPYVVTRAGTTQSDPMDPKAKTGDNVGLIMVYVDEYARNEIPHYKVLESLEAISKPEGVTRLEFEAKVNGPPVGSPINATFRSNEQKSLIEVINKIKAELEKVPGVKNLQIDDVVSDDEIFVNIDYIKADRLGLSVDSIGNTIRAAISGRRVSDVNLNNKEVELIVRLEEQDRKNIQDLENLTVMDSRGNLIPVGTVASFNQRLGSPHIKRFDYKRSKTLAGNVDEQVITAVEANAILRQKYNEIVKDYPDVTLVFGGEEENTKESMNSLFNALILSLIGIFALLVFLFRSYLRPAIIMSTIPLGLVGFSVAFFLQSRPISFLALIGVIGLGGIIVNSGIVLISFIDSMIEEGKLSMNEILVKASSMRLRAVVASSLTTISGLLPTAYGIGGSDAVLEPMTLAMAWGLTSGTILTVIWVPAAYAILEDLNVLIARLVGKSKSVIAVDDSKTQASVSSSI